MKHRFHPEALAEFQNASRYYSSKQAGLGLRFYDSVEHSIKQIVESPLRWPMLEEDIRRCLTRGFPYAVLYSVEAEFVLIIAVMHLHREPGYWHGRIAA
jgi:toxin ParE1/3/4